MSTNSSDIHHVRLDVMHTIEKSMPDFMDKFLMPIEENWQPSDLLPDTNNEDFFDQFHEIREQSKELSYDFWVTLVGDTVTEEALPSYESWLMDVTGVDQVNGDRENGWAKWERKWTAEENRHGDVLNKYLYLSGRVNMREVEVTIQHLIADGFDIGTDRDPYKNFVYTSFQELATNISHKRVAKLAADQGNFLLGKICKIVAGDEMRHYLAYREFVKTIFTYDPSEMMLAYYDMMKKKIVMPAHFVRESGGEIGTSYVDFSNCAQRLGVYTQYDYVDIIRKLNKYWEIETMTGLNEGAEKARDYLARLPARLDRITQRMSIPDFKRDFKWVFANGVMA